MWAEKNNRAIKFFTAHLRSEGNSRLLKPSQIIA